MSLAVSIAIKNDSTVSLIGIVINDYI